LLVYSWVALVSAFQRPCQTRDKSIVVFGGRNVAYFNPNLIGITLTGFSATRSYNDLYYGTTSVVQAFRWSASGSRLESLPLRPSVPPGSGPPSLPASTRTALLNLTGLGGSYSNSVFQTVNRDFSDANRGTCTIYVSRLACMFFSAYMLGCAACIDIPRSVHVGVRGVHLHSCMMYICILGCEQGFPGCHRCIVV